MKGVRWGNTGRAHACLEDPCRPALSAAKSAASLTLGVVAHVLLRGAHLHSMPSHAARASALGTTPCRCPPCKHPLHRSVAAVMLKPTRRRVRRKCQSGIGCQSAKPRAHLGQQVCNLLLVGVLAVLLQVRLRRKPCRRCKPGLQVLWLAAEQPCCRSVAFAARLHEARRHGHPMHANLDVSTETSSEGCRTIAKPARTSSPSRMPFIVTRLRYGHTFMPSRGSTCGASGRPGVQQVGAPGSRVR